MRKKIEKFLEVILVATMLSLVFVVVFQIITNLTNVVDNSFSDELAGFLLIWVAMLGAVYGTAKGSHLAIDILLMKLRDRGTSKPLEILIESLVGAFALFVMIIGGSMLVYSRFKLGVLSPSMQLPLGYVYSVIPLAGVLIMYFCVSNIHSILKKYK
ncbi:MAG: TRAP transporter small permease [Bacteroidales bacterium]